MRLRICFVLLLMFLFYCCSTVVEQLYGASGVRKHFLSHGPSVAAYGRGEVATSLLNDMSGAFYNPALPAEIKRGSLSLAHYVLFDGAMYNYFSLGTPLSDRTIMGLSGINLRSGDIELREAIDSNPRTVQTSQWLITGTLSADLRESLGVLCGFNLNYLYFDFAGITAGNIGIDAGIKRAWRGPFILGNRSQVHFGIAAQNLFAPVMQLKSQKETYPLTWRAGAALMLPVFFRYNPVKQTFHYDKAGFYTDVVYDTDAGDTRLAVGGEYSILNRYTLRTGFNDTFTLGAGAKFGDYQFDYAVDFKSYAEFHRIAVAFYWGEPPAEEDEDFAHFMSVYTRVERLYDYQTKTARELIDKRNYDSAITLLERTIYLLPRRRDAARELLKQARDLKNSLEIAASRDRATGQFQKGDYLASYKTLLESLNMSPEDVDTKVLLERTYNELMIRGLKVKQLKQDAVDNLVTLIKAAVAANDYEQAGMNLAKLKTLDGESFVYFNASKEIEESRQAYISSLIVRSQEFFNKKDYAEAILAAERVLAIDAKNSVAIGARKKAAQIVEKKLSIKDRLYSERLYYTAAEYYAKNDDFKAREALFNLIRFNPAHEYIYPLYFRLMSEKKIDTDLRVKDTDLDALRLEYQKTVISNRVKEFILAAKLQRQQGDIVKAYQSYLNAYDLEPDNNEVIAGLTEVYEEAKPKKKTPLPPPRPGEWMEMTGEVYEQRGGYKLPEKRQIETSPEFKEIEKIRADYIKNIRTNVDVLVAKGDYAGAEKELLKLKLFMSESEINKLRRQMR